MNLAENRPTLIALLSESLMRHPEASGAVICLCADWCLTCGDYKTVFKQAATDHPNLVFRWLDIEDEADALGDLNIETFPTLLIGNSRGTVYFAGPVPPRVGHIDRLLRGVQPA